MTPSPILTTQKVQLECSSNPEGLPKAQLIWEWNPNQVWSIPNNYRNLSLKASHYTGFDLPDVIIQDATDSLASILTISKISSQLHGARLFCHTIYKNKTIYSTDYLFLVTYPPKSIQMTNQNSSILSKSNSHRIHLVTTLENRPYLFICSTSRYYGNLSIIWYLENTLRMQNLIQYNQFTNLTRSKQHISKFQQIETSSVVFIPTRIHHSAIVKCEIGTENIKTAASIQIEVYYTPKAVIMRTNCCAPDSFMNVGDTIRIDCSVSDGNPIPELRVMLGNLVIFKQDFPKKDISTHLILERNFNFNFIYCVAHNYQFPKPHQVISSNKVWLQMALLPHRVILQPYKNSEDLPTNSKITIEDGQRQILECLVYDSYPEPLISWRLKLCQMIKFKDWKMFRDWELRRHDGCQLQELKATKTETTLSQSIVINRNVSISISQIHWQPTWRHHNSQIICIVQNPFFDKQTVKRYYRIRVKFVPQISTFPEHMSIVTVRKGNSKNLFNLTIISNPPLISLDLINCSNCQLLQNLPFKNNPTLKYNFTNSLYSFWLFNINNASDQDSNIVIIRASNKLGLTKYSFQLHVLGDFKKNSNSTQHVILSPLNNMLPCEMPNLEITPIDVTTQYNFRWLIGRIDGVSINTDISLADYCNKSITCNQVYRETGKHNQLFVKLYSKCSSSVSTLIFYDISLNDEGVYLCQIFIGDHLIYQLDYQVSVMVTPIIEIPKYHPRKIACGSSLPRNCIISCSYKAVGLLNIKWYKLEDSINNQLEQMIQNLSLYSNYSSLNTSNVTISTNSSQFILPSQYQIQISNIIGKSTETFIIVKPQKPEIPKNYQIINIQYNSAILIWYPGFSGGYKQIFRIFVCKELNSSNIKLGSNFTYEKWSEEDNYEQLSVKLENLDENSSYRIIIHVENLLGPAKFTPFLRFRTTAKLLSTKSYPNSSNYTTAFLSFQSVIISLSILCITIILAIFILICTRFRFYKLTNHSWRTRSSTNQHQSQRSKSIRSLNNNYHHKLYRNESDDKDLSMIFTNQRASTIGESDKKMESCETTIMNISEHQ